MVDGCTEAAWLDWKKSKEQLKPGRVIQRAERYLTDVLAGSGKDVNIDKRTREIKIDGVKVAWVIKSELRPVEPKIYELLSAEQPRTLLDYSNDVF